MKPTKYRGTDFNSVSQGMRKQFIDGEYAISDHAIIEAQKDGIAPRTVVKLSG